MLIKSKCILSIALSFLVVITAFTSCTITIPWGNDSKALSSSSEKNSTQQSSTSISSTASENQGGSGKVIIPGSFSDKSIVNFGKFKLTSMFKLNNKIFDRILGSSGNTSTSTPSKFALTSNDAKMPVLEYLGYGYDVFDNYGSSRYVKEGQILDLDKLIKDGKVFRNDLSESDYKEISSTSARSYATSVATSVKLSGNYLYFSGSVKSNFSSSHLEQANHYFSTIFYNISLYSLYIDPAVKLSDYVCKDAQNILETKDAKWIFENYGTHLVRSLQAGGRFDYNTSVDKKYVKDESSFSTSVKASFNAVFASANASVETSSSTVTEEFKQNSEIRIFTYGGDGIDGQSMKSDPQTLKKWMESVKTTPSLSNFGDNALIPIWEFCKSPTRKKYLEDEFKKYAEGKLNIVPSSYVVNGLRLNIVNLSDPIINDFKDESGEWHLVSNISAHTMLPNDKMAILYCRYGREDDPVNAPIVEIILENAKEKESVKDYFDTKYKTDKTAKLYGWNGTHNVNNSNLGVSINQQIAISAGAPEMFLFYVTSLNGQAVKSLIVRHVSPAGATAYIPHVPEENKKYEQILDKTLQKSGKIMAQDTGEGVASIYKNGLFSFPIYKNHFIEYTKD